MKKILVLGKNGQLGKALLANPDTSNWQFYNRNDLDLGHLDKIESVLRAADFDILINAAAYTAVDLAESEVEHAEDVNTKALNPIALVCKEKNALLIHISTDYVFGDVPPLPIGEEQETRPSTIYGKTKLAGEQEVQSIWDKHIILRTSWLYGSEGHNFMKTMLRVGANRPEVQVVFDQVGSPTNVDELASAICQIVQLPAEKQKPGTYHFSNEGVCSWFDFAKAIFDFSNMDTAVKPVRSDAFPSVAPRPAYSVLDKKKIKDTFGIQISHWQDGLRACLKALNSKND